MSVECHLKCLRVSHVPCTVNFDLHVPHTLLSPFMFVQLLISTGVSWHVPCSVPCTAWIIACLVCNMVLGIWLGLWTKYFIKIEGVNVTSVTTANFLNSFSFLLARFYLSPSYPDLNVPLFHIMFRNF